MKKITFLFVLLVTSIGFSQTNLLATGESPNAQNFENGFTLNPSFAPCAFDNPNTGIVNGLGMEGSNAWMLADDIDVAAGDDFTPDTFVFEYLNFNPNTIANADINFYADGGGGLPGALLFSLPGQVPTGQVIVGSAFSRDNIAATFDLSGSGVMLPGGGAGAKYWVAISADSPADTTFGTVGTVINGSAVAWSDNSGGSWSTSMSAFGADYQLFFSISGDCGGAINVCGPSPLPIPNAGTSGPMNPSPANVPDVGIVGTTHTIESVELDLNHTFDGDLDITLTSPMGTVLVLANQLGGAGNNYTNTVFMDGNPNITTGAPPFTGTFEPEGGTLNGTFATESITGDWTLNIFDNFFGDSGTLNTYCINFAPISTPPIIVCPGDVTANTDPGVCGATVNFADAVAIDPNGGSVTVVQTGGLPSGSVFPVGVSVIEFTATTDATGATSMCTFTITVTDNEFPVAVCQDITVQLDASGIYVLTPGEIDAGSSDNCGVASLEFPAPSITECGPSPLLIPEVGTSGAMLPSPANVTDTGLVGTDYSIASVELDLNHTFDGDLDITLTSPMGTVLVLADQLGGSGNNYTGTVFVDGSPNITTGSAPFTGMFEPQGGTLNGTFAGESITGDWTLNIFDNFGGDSGMLNNYCINFSPLVGVPDLTLTCADVGVNVVTLVVTDPSGNVTTCTANVTVEDNIAPVIVCIGEPATVTGTATSTPGLAITDNTTVSDVLNVGASETITDLDVVLDIDHTWVGDMQITLESPAGTQVLIFDGSTDGCSGDNIMDIYDDESANPLACVPASGDAFPLSDYIPSNALSAFDNEDTSGNWTLFIEDTAGGDTGTLNSWSLNYSFDIAATPLEVDLDANGMASINASALLLVTEACGWTATVDSSGTPVVLPTLFAGGNGQSGNMFDIMAINDLTVDSFDISVDSGITDDYEIYFKTGPYLPSVNTPGDWTMVASGNMTSAGDNVPTPLNLNLGINVSAGDTVAFYVTLVGTTAINYTNGTTTGALFTSDANMEFYEGAGLAYPFTANFNPRVWNGNILYTPGGGVSTTIDFTCDDLGSNQIEVTVTDDSGNVATCIATVNVNDVTPPVLVCMDVTIELDENGMATIDPAALLAQAPGYYEVISISSDNQSGAVGETDFTVPVTMAEAVSFDWDYSTLDGPGFDSFGYLLNGVYTELTDPVGANNQNGSAAVAVAPGDVFGFRSSSLDGLFGPSTTVVSNFLPGFAGQFDPANWTLTLTNSDGDAFFVFFPGGPLSFDACGITILAADVTEVDCDDIGTPITVTVFASDSSLNIAVCQSIVTVVDLLGPVVTCPADQTVDPGPGNLFWVIEDYFGTGAATATDNCTDPLTIFSQDPAPGTLLPDGVYTVTMSSTDEYGNVGVCTFELTVESILGVEDNKLDNAIGMYPNPALDRVTFTNTSGILLNKAVIHDMNGRQISTIDLRDMQQEKTVDVSNLSSGVYMVQFQSDDASTVKRLVKE